MYHTLLNTMSEKNSEFLSIDDLVKGNELVDCYQMQVNDENECKPVYLGKYPDVPLPVNKVIQYKKYDLHVVTYVLTKDEVENELYKIVGVNVFRRNRKNSKCSLDLAFNSENGGYQLIFNDHLNNTSSIVENIEKFPGRDKVLDFIVDKAFKDPVKAVLIKD